MTKTQSETPPDASPVRRVLTKRQHWLRQGSVLPSVLSGKSDCVGSGLKHLGTTAAREKSFSPEQPTGPTSEQATGLPHKERSYQEETWDFCSASIKATVTIKRSQLLIRVREKQDLGFVPQISQF